MNSYQARRQAKAERYAKYAENAAKRAEVASERAHSIMDMIPLGQPILVGHHSERRARRDQDRIQNGLMKASEESKKAAYWEHRAAAIENDTSIHREDPDALTLLDAKIAALEADAARRKLINQTIRKSGWDAALPLMTDEDKADLVAVAKYQSYYDPMHKGFPPYSTSNASANLRRYKARRAELAAPLRRILRELLTRYAGSCETCGASIAKGAVALYDRDAHAIYCNQECAR